MVIELDGAVHTTIEQAEKDKLRDRQLRELGFWVLRFDNRDVFCRLNRVLFVLFCY